jgi:TolB-like protein
MLGSVIYRFDTFELDPSRFELRQGGTALDLEPQVFALLTLLVEHRDRLVTKSEIFATLWEGRIVSDSALTSRIKSARRILGDDGKTQRFIKTVHGQGFRFVAEVTLERPRIVVAGESSDRADIHIETAQRPSTAVLPFQSTTASRSTRTLAEGLPHELITELARLRWLLVIARGSSFRFRSADTDPREAGRVLGVRYCLVGHIDVSDRRIVVATELTDTRTGAIVWAEIYTASREDIHAVRADIKSQILSALEIQIPMHEAAGARLISTDDLDAWSAYHLGLQHLYRYSQKDNVAAAALFKHAISKDEYFARAHAGLSFVHFQTAFMRQTDDIPGEIALARSCARRGLDIDPLDPFANFTMGRSFWLETDLESASAWLERATTLSPNYAQGLYARAWTSTIAGESRDVRPELDLAMRLSPLDPLYYAMLGARGFTHLACGEYEQAAAWTEQAARAPGAHVFMAVLAAAAQHLAGRLLEAESWAAEVRRRGPLIRSADFFRGYPVKAEPMRTQIADALSTLGF